jgi:hypothetical protein
MKNYKSYCEHCEREVFICGKCGMNTCSGGYGEVNGIKCDQCPSAYKEENENIIYSRLTH